MLSEFTTTTYCWKRGQHFTLRSAWWYSDKTSWTTSNVLIDPNMKYHRGWLDSNSCIRMAYTLPTELQSMPHLSAVCQPNFLNYFSQVLNCAQSLGLFFIHNQVPSWFFTMSFTYYFELYSWGARLTPSLSNNRVKYSRRTDKKANCCVRICRFFHWAWWPVGDISASITDFRGPIF